MGSIELLGCRKDKLAQFNKKGIFTIENLVEFLPKKYLDFTKPKYIKNLIKDEVACIIGEVLEVKGSDNKMVNIKVKDELNNKMSITFFNQSYLAKTVKVGEKFLIGGKVNVLENYNNYKTMTNPVLFTKDINRNLSIRPVYSSINKMSEEFLIKSIESALAISDKDDYLEPTMLSKYGLITKAQSNRWIHTPKSLDDLEKAKKRLLFDDLFKFNFKVMNSISHNPKSDINISSFNKTKKFMSKLPFELTDGQRLVLRSITTKMMKHEVVRSLVQGDVGVGKTLIAELLLIVLSENGYQGCLVAPTNILAKQHFNEIKADLECLGFNVAFLSGETTKRETTKILKGLADGTINIIIGTHSLFSEKVEFKNLGLAIIDEEHRFGTEQRNSLKKDGIHYVTMSATPIPRTIAMSMYGADIDVQTVATRPKGRQPIDTTILTTDKDTLIYDKILKEVQSGRQAYIVCPLISKSSSEKLNNVSNTKDEYKKAVSFFEKHNIKVGMVTGEMKDKDIELLLSQFRNKEFDVLISTTIIEVGVNVPNATIIVIKNADRFGFAQLHQLRGRVGRGNHKSYCYLLTDNVDKFDIFTKSNDGYEIAKQDLILRGAGSFIGTQQSGFNKYLMLILANEELNNNIKNDIQDIINDNLRLKRYKSLSDLSFSDIA